MSPRAARMRHRLWRVVFRLNGGLQVQGTLPSGGCVVVANHCSHADAPAMLAAIDPAHRAVVAAAADYWFDRPAKASLCRRLVAGFPVRRDGGGYSDLAAQGPALRDGRAVVVFPAGSRRSVDGRFHQGAFRLAQECGVPVVPVRVSGTANVLRSGAVPRRARITVEIGEPVLVTHPAIAAHDVQQSLRVPAAAVRESATAGAPRSRFASRRTARHLGCTEIGVVPPAKQLKPAGNG